MNQKEYLLATKLEIPSLRYRIIQRNRLTTLLQAGLNRRMTTIVAPAGYGKTTLVVEWLSTLKPTQWRVAWFSLDLPDNSPFLFWSYFAASLQRISPRFRYHPTCSNPCQPDANGILQFNKLINEISLIPFPVCLVLDNFEVIENKNISLGMAYLIEHLPDNMHLILASRVIPSIPLTRLQVENQLVEINAKDLSFNTQETQAFLTQAMGLDINSKQVAMLRNATEGWISGLKLLALSLHGKPDLPLEQNHLPCDNRQILAYLTEEVLDQQEQAIKNFLVKTSILSELSASLCDAILERTDSQDLLNRINEANLFVVSLDSQNIWYRYHTLFSQALREYLTQYSPESINELHQRACDWFMANGYPEKAATHALAAGDNLRAAEIVDATAIEAIVHMDQSTIVQLINNFSDDLLLIHPKLGIHYALACFMVGWLDLIEAKFQLLETTFKKSAKKWGEAKERKLIHWEISVIRNVLECVENNSSQSVPKLKKLIAEVPDNDGFFLGFINHWLAETYDSVGNLDAAADRYIQARQFAEENHLFNGMVDSSCGLARIRKKQGRLREAEKEYKQALDFAIRSNMDFGMVALAKTGLIEIALDRMDASINHDWIQELAEKLDQIQPQTLTWTDTIRLALRLADYYITNQEIDKAQQYLHIATDELSPSLRNNGFLCSEIIDIQMHIWSSSDRKKSLNCQLEQEINHLYETQPSNTAVMAAMARLSLVQNMPDKALIILSDLETIARKMGHIERLIETLILKSLALQANQQDEHARQTIQQALQIARPEGYIRVFVDEGEVLRVLLNECTISNQDIDFDDYLQKILAAFKQSPEDRSENVGQPYTTSLISPLIGTLSEREEEVLHLLVDGNSVKEIASNLMISVNTAKSHVKNIYRKMGGHSRKVVFQRAMESGILSQQPKH